MLIMSFFGWWYGRGWKHAFDSLGLRLRGTAELFSVKQLLQTWFEPWRRIVSVPGSSFEDKLRAWGDNMVSRGVGFVIRTFILFAALVSTIAVGSLTVAEIIVWPLVPIATPIMIVGGLLG